MKDTGAVTKKTILKVISFFIAVILWLFITYTEDMLIDVTINSVDVVIANEGELSERGLMVINKASIPKASVVIRGKRGDIIGVMDNMSAAVDVSQISGEGKYNLKPEFDIPSSAVYIAKQKTIDVPVEIAKISEKTVEVRVVQKNQDNSMSYIVESIPVKKSLTVKGAPEDIESIHHAAVYVDVSKVLENGVDNYSVVLENEENSELLIANDLYMETDEVQVFNYIYEKKTLPVNISVSADTSHKYAIKVVGQTKKEIEVGIKTDEGKDVTELVNLPITDELKPGTNEYEVLIDVPQGIYIEEDKKTIKIKLEVYEKTEKVISMPIKVRNPENRSYELLEDRVSIRVEGPAEKLKSDYITALLDISLLEPSGEEQTAVLDIISNDEDVSVKSTRIHARIKINN